MPLDERKWLKELRQAGLIVRMSGHNHYMVYDADGAVVGNYAVCHKRGGKREVLDPYVNKIRKVIWRRADE